MLQSSTFGMALHSWKRHFPMLAWMNFFTQLTSFSIQGREKLQELRSGYNPGCFTCTTFSCSRNFWTMLLSDLFFSFHCYLFIVLCIWPHVIQNSEMVLCFSIKLYMFAGKKNDYALMKSMYFFPCQLPTKVHMYRNFQNDPHIWDLIKISSVPLEDCILRNISPVQIFFITHHFIRKVSDVIIFWTDCILVSINYHSISQVHPFSFL